MVLYGQKYLLVEQKYLGKNVVGITKFSFKKDFMKKELLKQKFLVRYTSKLLGQKRF